MQGGPWGVRPPWRPSLPGEDAPPRAPTTQPVAESRASLPCTTATSTARRRRRSSQPSEPACANHRLPTPESAGRTSTPTAFYHRGPGRSSHDTSPCRAEARLHEWAACRGEHPRVLHGVKARRRAAFREPTQQRERIHVHCDRPVGEGALERQPHQPVLLKRGAFLGDRGSQHVAQQRLPRRGMVRTGARRRVQGEAVERSAQRLVVRKRARRRRREPAEPLRGDDV
jgi:hypothetical protein